jgi:uncharacterized protein
MRIAVVGAGISGLVAAFRLQHAHEVSVFEAEPWIGGHTHTVNVEDPLGPLAIDTGFIVFNDWTYPNFIALLENLKVEALPTRMSFSVRCENSGLEYNGTNLNSLFAQRRNLLSPRFWNMMREILRFNRESTALLDQEDVDISLGDYLDRQGYGQAFREDYLLPMGAAIWSAPPAQTAAMPARYFVEFFSNHGMLSIDARPQWRVVRGGSAAYVEALLKRFRGTVRASTPVERIERDDQGVTLRLQGDASPLHFDAVVLACHSDQALALLAQPSDAENEILGAIRYQPNDVVLHTDSALLPKRKLAWAAWNYRRSGRSASDPVSVTYSMNILQNLTAARQYCVTLNDTASIDASQIIGRYQYSHPCYSPAAVAAQRRIHEINGVNRSWFCGAYWGWGFHEDGVVSALRVVRGLEA